MVDKNDSDGKMAAKSVTLSLLAGFVARILARMVPEQAREILRDPEKVLGIKIPGEFLSTAVGGFVGWTVMKVIRVINPGFKLDNKDAITSFAVMVGEELDDILKEEGKKPDTKASGSAYLRKLVVCDSCPGVIYLLECPANHVMVGTPVLIDNGKGGKRREIHFDPRPDFRPITVQTASRLMQMSGGRTPRMSQEGWTPVCVCETEVPAVIDDYKKQLAEASKPPKPPVQPLITRDDWHKAGQWALRIGRSATTAIGDGGRAAGHAVKAAGTRVSTTVRAVDDHLKTTDASLASGIRTRTQQIKAEHAARVAGRKK